MDPASLAAVGGALEKVQNSGNAGPQDVRSKSGDSESDSSSSTFGSVNYYGTPLNSIASSSYLLPVLGVIGVFIVIWLIKRK